MRPVINTEKHFVQQSLFTVAASAMANKGIVTAVAVPGTSGLDVREGAIISAIYVEMWITSDDATAGTCVATLEKLPSGKDPMTAAESALLFTYTNKKNILHTFQGLVSTNVQYPTAILKGWFKIPKGKQRFGLGDKLKLNILAQSNGLNGCGFFLFKEQY